MLTITWQKQANKDCSTYVTYQPRTETSKIVALYWRNKNAANVGNLVPILSTSSLASPSSCGQLAHSNLADLESIQRLGSL